MSFLGLLNYLIFTLGPFGISRSNYKLIHDCADVRRLAGRATHSAVKCNASVVPGPIVRINNHDSRQYFMCKVVNLVIYVYASPYA